MFSSVAAVVAGSSSLGVFVSAPQAEKSDISRVIDKKTDNARKVQVLRMAILLFNEITSGRLANIQTVLAISITPAAFCFQKIKT